MKPSFIRMLICAGMVFSSWAVQAQTTGSVPGDAPVEMTLETAVRVALNRNLGLRLKRIDADQAAAAVETEKSIFDPTVEASVNTGETRSQSNSLASSTISKQKTTAWHAGVAKSFEPGTQLSVSWNNDRTDSNSPFLDENPAYRSSVEAGVTQPLLKGLGIEYQTAGVRAAEQHLEAADLQTKKEASDLVANVKAAYWELVFAYEDNDVRKLALTRAGALLDETQSKIKAGTLAPVDIYESEAELARREQDLIDGERNIAAAADALKSLMNAQDWTVSIKPITSTSALTETPPFQSALDRALSDRPDLQAAERALTAARILRGRTKDGRKPTLDFTATAGLSGLSGSYGEAVSRYGEDDVYTWNIGLLFTVPIPNRAGAAADAAALAEEERAATQIEVLTQDIHRTVREAVRDVDVTGRTIAAAARTSLASKKRLEAEEAKFRVGLSTSNLVLQAQEAYVRALSGEKRAQVDHEKAKAELQRVQGDMGLGG